MMACTAKNRSSTQAQLRIVCERNAQNKNHTSLFQPIALTEQAIFLQNFTVSVTQ